MRSSLTPTLRIPGGSASPLSLTACFPGVQCPHPPALRTISDKVPKERRSLLRGQLEAAIWLEHCCSPRWDRDDSAVSALTRCIPLGYGRHATIRALPTCSSCRNRNDSAICALARRPASTHLDDSAVRPLPGCSARTNGHNAAVRSLPGRPTIGNLDLTSVSSSSCRRHAVSLSVCPFNQAQPALNAKATSFVVNAIQGRKPTSPSGEGLPRRRTTGSTGSSDFGLGS